VARNARDLEELTRETSAKSSSPTQRTNRRVNESCPNQTEFLVLSAGTPLDLRPLHEHTWETFSKPWKLTQKLTFLGSKQCCGQTKARACCCVRQWRSTFRFPAQRWLRRSKEDERLYRGVPSGVASRAKPRFVPLLGSSDESAYEFGAAAARAYAKMAGQTFEDFVKVLPSLPRLPTSVRP